MNYVEISKATIDHLYKAHHTLKESPLDDKIRNLVELRVSQINGCTYCCKVHSEDARQAGVTQRQLDLLPAWYEAKDFSEKEKIALAWAEKLTKVQANQEISHTHLLEHFSEREVSDLTITIGMMNAFNRMAMSLL